MKDVNDDWIKVAISPGESYCEGCGWSGEYFDFGEGLKNYINHYKNGEHTRRLSDES